MASERGAGTEVIRRRVQEDAKLDGSADHQPQVVSTRRRTLQRRAIETKQAILNAALSEFAQFGFDAASIRNIAAATSLQHPLITYHYPTKDILWQAVAENAFAQIRDSWDELVFNDQEQTPLERLRSEYFAFIRFTLSHPDFHHFMLRESRPGNPRLPWLVKNMLLPTMRRLLPQVEDAQAQSELPPGNPALIHYLMVGMTSVLSSLKDEIRQAAGIDVDEPAILEEYLGLLDALIFRPASSSKPKRTSQ